MTLRNVYFGGGAPQRRLTIAKEPLIVVAVVVDVVDVVVDVVDLSRGHLTAADG